MPFHDGLSIRLLNKSCSVGHGFYFVKSKTSLDFWFTFGDKFPSVGSVLTGRVDGFGGWDPAGVRFVFVTFFLAAGLEGLRAGKGWLVAGASALEFHSARRLGHTARFFLYKFPTR